MILDDIKGNDYLKEKLKSIAASSDIHHAYIIEGPLSAEKEALADCFAKALLCAEKPAEGCDVCPVCRRINDGNYIDLIKIRADYSNNSRASSIKDKDVESLIERIKTKPGEGDRNIAVICDADYMTKRAANRLLKTLEEPPYGTVIILLSENMNNLPITIRSRCVHLRMLSQSTACSEYAHAAKSLADMTASRGKYYEIKKLIESVGRRQQDADLFLDRLEDEYRNRLIDPKSSMKKDDIFKAVQQIEKTRSKIRRKLDVQYALKQMAIDLGR